MRRWRITGASLPFGGLQWEYREGDAEIARRVISFMEDRRMLWVDIQFEMPEDCFASASKARDALTEQIATSGIGAELAATLKQMRKLFADFMTVRHFADHPRHPRHFDLDEFSVALGVLRTAVGERLAWIAATYGLDIDDELRQIIPDTGAWFFEAFDDA